MHQTMTTLLMVFLATSTLLLARSSPLPGVDSRGRNRTRRDVHCRHELEYLHGGVCCALCPAGTMVTSHCTRPGERGKCEPCDHGLTFTEHDNGLGHCFKCTRCRSDQEVARPCAAALDAECRCKSGLFCSPDEPCEVCKKCRRCGKDEEVVRNCSATTNTECKKVQPKSDSGSVTISGLFALLLFVPGIIITGSGLLWWFYKKRQETTDPETDSSDDGKTGQRDVENRLIEERLSAEALKSNWQQLVRAVPQAGSEEERQVLCGSFSSSASNSSLTGPTGAARDPLQPSPVVPVSLPDRRTDEDFPKLVPVNGEESLRKCFEFFEEVDSDFHKRFFRQLGVADNVIKSKESLPYEERIHELLNIWVEREGRDASLNTLLAALLYLRQRRTAEIIVDSALHDGLYVREC